MSMNHDWVPDLWTRTIAALDPDPDPAAAGEGTEDGPGDGKEAAGAGPYCVQSDWTRSDGPSQAVVEAVAAVTDRDPTTMPPLYYWVDTDALDGLLTHDGADDAAEVHVSFDYDGVDVVVASTGTLEVCASPETVD